ncbi:MAG: hypothetical protein ACJ8R9_17845 [Steroidobacteraceae bacterium]
MLSTHRNGRASEAKSVTSGGVRSFARAVALGAQEAQPPRRLPLLVRTARDVETLRAHPSALRRLPRQGIPVALSGLDPKQTKRFEARIRAYIRACGCAEGGIAALVSIGASFAWILSHIYQSGPRLRDVAVVIAALLLGGVLGGLGKLLGVAIARLRFVRSCDEIMRLIKGSDSQAGGVAE